MQNAGYRFKLDHERIGTRSFSSLASDHYKLRCYLFRATQTFCK